MIRRHIPNFITCLNVVSGSLAVLFAIKGELTLSAIFIFVAALFDFFDGVAARQLNAWSPIGKELDSLADMVSFGLAPGMLMMVMQEYALFGINVQAESFTGLSFWEIFCLAATFLIPVSAALRLAKFNIDTRQTNSFIGLPTPASALFIAAMALITVHGRYATFDDYLLQPIVLLIITIIISFLLISELPMFSLKFKTLKWNDNRVRFLFIITSSLLILALNIYGLATSIAIYIILSLFLRLKK